MKLFHITKQGNLHFQLKDGRLAAIYPKSGYVRVSHSLSNFSNPAYAERARLRNDNAVRLKNPGNVVMYQINPVRKIKKLQRVTRELFYKNRWLSHPETYHKFLPEKVFFEYECNERERYPNDVEKLYDLLAKFELNNCTMTADKNWQY
jgi:hypothetical protein